MYTYANQETTTDIIQPVHSPKKGKKGAIARLIVSGLLFGLIMILAISTTTNSLFSGESTIGEAIVSLLSGIGGGCIIYALIWFYMKWTAFVAPKSFRWANNFWRRWIPLTIFGLLLKCYIWLVILLFPFSLATLAYSPCFLLLSSIAEYIDNFFVCLLFTLVSAVVMAFLVFWDICKIKGSDCKAALKEKFASFKK